MPPRHLADTPLRRGAPSRAMSARPSASAGTAAPAAAAAAAASGDLAGDARDARRVYAGAAFRLRRAVVAAAAEARALAAARAAVDEAAAAAALSADGAERDRGARDRAALGAVRAALAAGGAVRECLVCGERVGRSGEAGFGGECGICCGRVCAREACVAAGLLRKFCDGKGCLRREVCAECLVLVGEDATSADLLERETCEGHKEQGARRSPEGTRASCRSATERAGPGSGSGSGSGGRDGGIGGSGGSGGNGDGEGAGGCARRFCDECVPRELHTCVGDLCAGRRVCSDCRTACPVAGNARERKRRRVLANNGTLWASPGSGGGSEAERRSARLCR